ncbi:MAG: ATP-binding protein [Bacilli bacterium]|nr:ATP-binding protein [Bacilli bacterium]
MLKRIEIRNVNSIEKCEIDLTKGNYKFAEENLLGDTVNPIAIYGHNGSGKSSVMTAIGAFISLMYYPAEALQPFVVNDFLFQEYINGNKQEKNKVKGSILLEFDINNEAYEYFLETTRDNYISFEYLKKNSNMYFERKNKNYSYKEENHDIKDYSPMVPLLRILASSEIMDSTIQGVFAYISSFTFINLPFINRGSFVTSKLFNNTNINDLLVRKSEDVKKLLKEYDNFPVYTITKNNKMAPNGMLASQYNLVFDKKGFKKQIPLQMISVGMHNQSVLLSIILTIPENSIVFIDEVDLALHPSTIKSFLKVIRDKKIQVIFTLHNTYVLQMLRPDQVYFAKWSKGFSNYFRLSKIYPNIREVNNIEKMYLSSLFDEAIEENE